MPAASTSRPAARRQDSTAIGIAAAALVVAAVTLLLYPLSEADPGVSSGVLYVLGVLLIATYWGLWLGLATSLASALALLFFHTQPTGSLHVTDGSDVVAILVLLLTACVGSVIADRARMRAREAEQRLLLEAELRAAEAERIRLEEVRQSRVRVVEATYDERRRLVRDLHDGAQQRLVHTILTLKLAQRPGQEEQARRELLADAISHAQAATDELRELAHGILPAILLRGGLEAGVDAVASRMPIPVRLEIVERRFPSIVEATAYFVVAEALTNAAKHAQATRAWVTAEVRDGRLRVEVGDDGAGGAVAGGPGLLGMDDRVTTVDGELRIDSPPGGPTVVVATLPIPAADDE